MKIYYIQDLEIASNTFSTEQPAKKTKFIELNEAPQCVCWGRLNKNKIETLPLRIAATFLHVKAAESKSQ